MKKKIIYAVCMMGLIAVVATSCKKKEETATYAAQIECLEDGGVFGVEERAYMDPSTFTVYWNTGDEIKVYNIKDNYLQTITEIYTVDQGNTTSSHVTGASVGTNSVFYAFYPASMCKTGEHLLEGNYEVFELSDEQPLATPGGAWTFCNTSLPMAAKCVDHKTFDFKNIFGVARFRLTASGTDQGGTWRIAGLKVVDNHFHLSGQVTLKPHKLNSDKLTQIMSAFKGGADLNNIGLYNSYVLSHTGDGLGYSAQGGGNYVIYSLLDRPGGGLEVSAANNQSVDILVSLRPGALAYGFKLYVYVYQGLNVPTSLSDCVEVEIDRWNTENRNFVSEPNKIKTFTRNFTEDFE
jgi:hypothetical protein